MDCTATTLPYVPFGSVCDLYNLVVKFGITSLVRSQASHQNVLETILKLAQPYHQTH